MKRERNPEGRYKAVAELAALLIAGNKSIDELVEITGMHVNTVGLWCAALHKAGAAHIASWRQDSCGRWAARIFKLGPGIDAKRPPPTSRQRKSSKAPVRVATCWQEKALPPWMERGSR